MPLERVLEKSMIKEVFINEILPAVNQGVVKIKETDEFLNQEVEFNYNVHYKKDTTDHINTPVLTIKNEPLFYEELETYVRAMIALYPKPEYITEHEYIKKILALAFNNATYSDFLNPENYLRYRIDFLKQVVPLELSDTDNYIPLLNVNINTNIERQSMMLETPYVFKSILASDQYQYRLPDISFGISDNVCYIYGVQDKKQEITEEMEALQAKIKQGMKDINLSVPEEYGAYYKKRLRNTTPSFVLALSIFLDKMNTLGIQDMKVVPFLPIRYYAKEKANKVIAKTKAQSEEEYHQILEYLNQRQLNIQKNVTDKFMRTFEKIEYMTDMIEIGLKPFEYDDFMHIELKPKTRCDNVLLDQVMMKNAYLSNIEEEQMNKTK